MLFTLPADFVTSTVAYIGGLFTDLEVLIVVAIGIPLAFYVIRKIMSLMPKK